MRISKFEIGDTVKFHIGDDKGTFRTAMHKGIVVLKRTYGRENVDESVHYYLVAYGKKLKENISRVEPELKYEKIVLTEKCFL